MNVQIPVKWLQELLALCGPEDHELRERVMVSITAMDEQAARAVARDALIPAKPVHPKGMTSINARLSFNLGWMECERHHGIRSEDVEQAVAIDAAIAAAKEQWQ